jgi:hypothetical protein
MAWGAKIVFVGSNSLRLRAKRIGGVPVAAPPKPSKNHQPPETPPAAFCCVAGGGIMAFSSLFVVGNSLRITRGAITD